MIELLHCDCMEYMATVPDKYFDLSIVDPPYGMDRKMDGTGGAGRVMRKWKREGMQCWDVAPTKEYWLELFRISKNQIVWGLIIFYPICQPLQIMFFGINISLLITLQMVNLRGQVLKVFAKN